VLEFGELVNHNKLGLDALGGPHKHTLVLETVVAFEIRHSFG